MWDENLGKIDTGAHRIVLAGLTRPVHKVTYRAGTNMRRFEKREIDRMLEKGVIEPINTEWASTIVMVAKKDESFRFYVDYRKLNNQLN